VARTDCSKPQKFSLGGLINANREGCS